MRATIAVDIGNTATKIGWISNMATSALTSESDESVIHLHEILVPSQLADITFPVEKCNWYVTCVNQIRFDGLAAWVHEYRGEDQLIRIGNQDVPLSSTVDSRDQVGTDRLVAAFAAMSYGQAIAPRIVIDSGTATTIDFVIQESFQGGAILPGIGTMLHSLSRNTDALPDLREKLRQAIADDMAKRWVGKNTSDAILIGVLQAQIGILNHFITQHRIRRNDLQVIATGGGIEVLREFLPKDVIYVDNLVLRGTLEIGCQLSNPF